MKKLAVAAILVLAVVAVAAGLVFVQWRPPPANVTGPPSPKEEIVLKVITRHMSDILVKTEKAFLESEYAEKYNIVDIRWIPQGPPLWVDTVKSAGDIDVAWGGGPVLFDILVEEGLLAPLEGSELEPVLAKIPDEISGSPMKRYDEEGNLVWVASAIASFGFTINEEYLEAHGLPEPDEWADLASEIYAATLPSPSVGCADATKSTSNTRMYEIILQRYGWEKGWIVITLLAANSRIFDQSGLVRDAVMRGDVGVGITIDFYGYTAQLQNPACKYIIPKDGSIVNGDPIALLKTSKHPEAAKAFIAWILSVEGQKIWLDPNINRLPANPEVFDTPEGMERSDLREMYETTLEASVIEFSDELARSYERSLQWFFHATLVRAQDKLQRAWMELVKAKAEGRITEEQFEELVVELASPLKITFVDPKTGRETTFTQEYALSINDDLRVGEFKDEIVRIWREAAEERYEKVLEILAGGS